VRETVIHLQDHYIFFPNGVFTKCVSSLFVFQGEGHDLTLSFHAHKEKLLRENVTLTDSNDSSRLLMVVLHARVLGKYYAVLIVDPKG